MSIRTIYQKCLPDRLGLAEFLAHHCAFCHGSLDQFKQRCCDQCYSRLPITQEHRMPQGVYSPFYYRPPVDQLIQRGKTPEGLTDLAVLSHISAKAFRTLTQPMPQAIIPVPLHTKRIRQRGFNQAVELAKPIAKALGLPIITAGISRNRHTKDQKTLTPVERKKNVQGAFCVKKIDYKNVVIFDDVFTTGATTSALAKELKRQGVKQVNVWTIAYASNR